MKKTTVYLPPRSSSPPSGVSPADESRARRSFLRQAVLRLTEEAESPEPKLPLFRSNGPSHRFGHRRSVEGRLRRTVIVLDTGGLYAAIDANEDLHGRCVAALVGARPPRVISPFVLAELDYLVGSRVGHQAQLSLVDEVVRGAYRLEPFDADDMERAKRVMDEYADLRVGLADASVVVLAQRNGTLRFAMHGRTPFSSVPRSWWEAVSAPAQRCLSRCAPASRAT